MKKSFLLLVLLSLSGCSLFSPQPGQHSQNNAGSASVSEDKGEGLFGIDPEDARPLSLLGSEKITLLGGRNALPVSVNDLGGYQVFVSSGATGDILTREVTARLLSPEMPKTKESLSIKSASLDVPGDRLVIPGGAAMAEHVIGVAAVVSVSGEDLIIDAKTDYLTMNSYLIFKDTLPKSYLIQDPYNRFGSTVYMIPDHMLSLFSINRGVERSNTYLQYSSGKQQYTVAQFDVDGRYVTNAMHPHVVLPPKTKFTMTTDTQGMPTVWHLRLSETQTAAHAQTVAMLSQSLGKNGVYAVLGNLGGLFLEGAEQLTENASGAWDVTTTENPFQALLVADHVHISTLPFDAIDTFDVQFSTGYSDEYNPYVGGFFHEFPLDHEQLSKTLIAWLGTGVVDMWYDDNFNYRIQPHTHYKKTIPVHSIYGHTAMVDVDLFIDAIAPQFITKQIVSNTTVSILPKSGSFSDVLIQFQNISGFAVSLQSCTLSATEKLEENRSQGVENGLFNCQGPIIKKNVSATDFVYRKVYRHALPLPEELQSAEAFRVFFTDAQGVVQEHHFMKSDIGLWTKLQNNKLFVRGFTFDTGEPITSGQLTISDLNGKGVQTKDITGALTVIDLPETIMGDDYVHQWKYNAYLVRMTSAGDTAVIVVTRNGDERVYRDISQKINSKLSPYEVMDQGGNSVEAWGSDEPRKVYGFTDRGLYKAGETINMAGFVRDVSRFDTLDYLSGYQVQITLQNFSQGDATVLDPLPLDAFGGFSTSWTLPTSVALGEYQLTYTLLFSGETFISYSHNIKVEEYQKPTFYAEMSHQEKEGKRVLSLKPVYYFGTPLSNYDVQINRSLQGKETCRYCRWEKPEQFYFNQLFDDQLATGGSVRAYQQHDTAQIPLYDLVAQKNKGYNATLKVEAIIKDNISDETQFITKYLDFTPEVEVGLEGQPYEFLYEPTKQTAPTHPILGKIKTGKEKIAALRYAVYYRSYDQELQQGIDGSMYYISSNGQSYLTVATGDLTVATSFSVPGGFITKPGEYFIRVFAEDEHGTILGEVQKRIERYQFTDETDGLLGSVPNNYTLSVTVPKRKYEEGESIPIDIAPYQKGAWVVVTVERGNQIIDHQLVQLDGKQLSVKVKPGYAPNVVISVMELQSTQLSQSARKEPRFFAGYAEAEVSVAMHEMNVVISSSKPVYKPGEEVTLHIKTTDSKGNPVDAKLSIGVIDQSLVDFYHLIKEPIPYFFSKRGTSIFTFTNMKLLYQSLKAFATGGTKGGGGAGGKAMFSYIRNDLKDLARWSGGVITTNGEATVQFTLPENLTTRYVDALGITKGTQIGAANTTFVARKDLIIETNPPLFVTPGDHIAVPLKVLATKKGTVKGTATLLNAYGEAQPLGTFETTPGEKTLIDLVVPKGRYNSPYVTLRVSGTLGSLEDGVEQIIPLRSDGLQAKTSQASLAQSGTLLINIPPSLMKEATFTIGQLPTALLEPVFTYLIHYPYGCSEQLISSLYPLIMAKQWIKDHHYASPLLVGDTVLLENGPVDISVAIHDGINKLLKNQRDDGIFAYRPEGKGNVVTEHEYILSAYIYGGLRLLANDPVYAESVRSALEKLTNGMALYHDLSPQGYLRYLYQKSVAGTVLTPDENTQLNTLVHPGDQNYGPLLRYLIAVYQKDTKAMQERSKLAFLPTNRDERTPLSIYLNPITAQAMLLQGQLHDPQVIKETQEKSLQALLTMRDANGLWQRSTQNNVQALMALSTVVNERKSSGDVTCAITIDGKEQNITLGSTPFSGHFSPDADSVKIQRSCDSLVMGDSIVTYVPQDKNALVDAKDGVNTMALALNTTTTPIGESLEVSAGFITTIPGEQVAVEIFVPATTKILNTITAKNPTQQNTYDRQPTVLPFTISDEHCTPTHRETRFDRLFLYYDRLEPGACDFTFPVLQAYSGTAAIMPFRIYEMYKGKLNGRKIIR